MNKKINYKVMAAFSSFTLAVASLVTVTLAWYEFSNAVQVDNLSYSIYDDTGVLQLGLKDTTGNLKGKYDSTIGEWVDDVFYFTEEDSNINTDVLIDFGQYDETTTLRPITNAYYDNWFNNVTDINTDRPQYTKTPTIDDKKGETVVTREEIKSHYYEFEFYVRATNVPVFVFLSNMITVVPDTAKNAQTAIVTPQTQEQLNKVSEYIRIGFFSHLQYTGENEVYDRFTYNIFDANPSYDEDKNLVPTNYYGRLDLDPQNGLYDVEATIESEEENPNYRKNETLYGRYDLLNGANFVYSEDARVTGTDKELLTGGFFANSWERANPLDIQKTKEENGDNFVLYQENAWNPKRVTSSSSNAYKRIDNTLCYVTRQKAVKLIITIWAEGWDLDCNRFSSNSAFEAKIILNGRDPSNLDEFGK